MTALKSTSEDELQDAPWYEALFAYRGRPFAGFLAIVLFAVVFLSGEGLDRVRNLTFDLWQQLNPRVVETLPVRIVEVDEESLREFGQWPWPRYRMARIIEQIQARGALAIGLDILFVEPDRLSPEALAGSDIEIPDVMRHLLRQLPSNDSQLAEQVGRAPVVLGRAGVSGPEADAWRDRAPYIIPLGNTDGVDLSILPSSEALVTNLDDLGFVAAGHGLLDGRADSDGIVRKVPMIMNVGGVPHASLGAEMIRVAIGTESIVVIPETRGLDGLVPLGALQFGDTVFPVENDSTIRPHFFPSLEQRYVSARALFDGSVPPDAFANQLVLVGITGLGLLDSRSTPVSPAIPGVEIHAQAIETLLSGTGLNRPGTMIWVEAAILAVLAALVIGFIPTLPVIAGAGVFVVGLVGLGATSFILFQEGRLLFDPLLPGGGVLIVYCILGGALLSEANKARAALARQLDRARLEAARISGELQAARQIQTGILPDPESFSAASPYLGIHAHLESAKEVGGDLYDLAMLDSDRLYFMAGDVTGKGVPASLFMALSKAISKGAILRGEAVGQTLEAVIDVANEEISRENPASMFVTVFAGIIDATTGEVLFVNAGHEDPHIISPDGSVRALECDGGPPLCVFEGFPYPLETMQLAPGETLLITTDGVTEARREDGELFGHERTIHALQAIAQASDLKEGCDALVRDVRSFEDGADATDDLTIVAVRYLPDGEVETAAS